MEFKFKCRGLFHGENVHCWAKVKVDVRVITFNTSIKKNVCCGGKVKAGICVITSTK